MKLLDRMHLIWGAVLIVGSLVAVVLHEQFSGAPFGMVKSLALWSVTLAVLVLMVSQIALLRWLHPELRYCGSIDEEGIIVDEALSFRGAWLLYVLAFIISAVAMIIFVRLLSMLGILSTPFGVAVAEIGTGVWCLFYGWPLVYFVLVRRRIARRIRFLVNRSFDQSLCLYCGYDLRGTPDHCPECGHDPADPPREVADLIV